MIFAGTNGFLDPIPVEEVGKDEQELYRFFETRKAALLHTLADKKQFDDGLKAEFVAALKEFAACTRPARMLRRRRSGE